MKCAAPLFTLLISLVIMTPITAHGASTGCLPAPLPTTTTPPVFSRDLQRASVAQTHLDVWRLTCPDGVTSIVLARLTPIRTEPFICSINLTIVQGGTQFEIELTDENETFAFCGNLFTSRTFYLAPDGATYNPDEAFTLIYFDRSTLGLQPLEITAARAQPPLPPSVTVVSTACNPCHSGQTGAFSMFFTNPGPPFVAEVKGGARFPDGSILPLVNTVTNIPSGPSVLTLVPAQALPPGLPTIDLGIEAAILEPALGVTLSRHSVTLHLLP
jgi:hypothetical protein